METERVILVGVILLSIYTISLAVSIATIPISGALTSGKFHCLVRSSPACASFHSTTTGIALITIALVGILLYWAKPSPVRKTKFTKRRKRKK